jgi:hypothetical protein
MAQRRMLSQKIVGSDAFLEMPVSARELYFQLGMYADDDGFINPKKIIRMVSASDDDIKMLIAKRFVLPFENGVIVIKHWLINNLVRKDFYQPTNYLEQKQTLFLKENGSYTENPINGKPLMLTKCKQNVNKMLTQDRIGKDRIDNTIATTHVVADTPFSFNGYLEAMKADKNRHIQIIALYWKWRGLDFGSKELTQKAISRDLRPAKALVGYTNEEIEDTMDYIDGQRFIKKPTLETVNKYIAELKAGNL